MKNANNKRIIDGVLLLDKPKGISSNSALQKIKKLYSAEKAGHTGALDPLATGVLPICLGEATKYSSFLLESDKKYKVKAQLGIRTTTSDADGDIVDIRNIDITIDNLKKAIYSFVGKQKQMPSIFSALKFEGKPLYYYARKNISVPRKIRDIHVFSIDINEIDLPYIDLSIHCSKGTYIRTIIDDLGEKLECGAHVVELRRTGINDLEIDEALSLEDIEKQFQEKNDLNDIDKFLKPLDTLLSKLDVLNLPEHLSEKFLHGQKINLDQLEDRKDLLHDLELYRVYNEANFDLLGVASINNNIIIPKRVRKNRD
ncbi:tRNA pseudouridine(55) synthase TruB [Paraphotobacterium marinum]|uniref:tRNA pseudouridine synthase B n=1 Tax=Paraphotobacterium marinum TaxID=1755811 RepID=A0A220VDF6_9GAMM|nr:tRNA pseudouridine(55) synthase TruB [Paraphotobacterium marinum]ASK78379.1 tRNA pseudouridine(55) synthase TruB [Paraphotobacterium marinum]